MSKFMSFQLDKYGEITDFAMKKAVFQDRNTNQKKKFSPSTKLNIILTI